jgi:predicted porin
MRLKPNLLLLTMPLLVSVPAIAQDSLIPELYGRININAEIMKPDSGDSESDIVSNASRLGVRGSKEISPGLELIYQIEYEVDPADGDISGQSFKQRNSFLGFEGAYGTILVGKHDTPLKETQNRIDLFNDMIGDIKNVVDGENRVNDIILYESPEYSGFHASLATIAGGQDSDFTSSISASVTYENDLFYAALGLDSDVENRDVVRFVSQLYLGNLTLGALYQESEKTQVPGADKEDGTFVSAAYKVNKFTWKAQYGVSDERAPGKEQLTTGFDYSLGDNTKLFTYITTFAADNSALENDHYGIGFEHRF